MLNQKDLAFLVIWYIYINTYSLCSKGKINPCIKNATEEKLLKSTCERKQSDFNTFVLFKNKLALR